MNRLAGESSPYLRQHADNPVDWYPWCDAAFEEAERLNRPVLLSVGYSACHWCHVMAHESFEDEATAAMMNRLFVNVKVDREERPDVDEVYMAAVTAMTGQGGWPMTVFLTPQGAPFFAGTYFPPTAQGNRPSFQQVMEQINQVWQRQHADVLEQSAQVVAALRSSLEQSGAGDADNSGETGGTDGAGGAGGTSEAGILEAAVASLKQRYDPAWGGFGMAPKFPQTMSLEFLLRRFWRTGDTDLLQLVENTFDCMASGGIYDHLGGGFARYSVDRQWLVPHFEKMLYDNALLARVGLHLWQLTGKARYRQVTEETIGYVLRELRDPDGGFYSAQDADSEGEEGKYYVWSDKEFKEVARQALATSTAPAGEAATSDPAASNTAASDEQLARAAYWYGVTEQGNFEGSNILWRTQRGDLLRPDRIEAVRQALLARRSQRTPPGLDNKVLTEWNALMLATLAEAAAATGNSEWLQTAVANGEFLCTQLKSAAGAANGQQPNRWLRLWQPDTGPASYLAYGVDYAALLDGFISLYGATGQLRWLAEACQVADQLLELFWDDTTGGIFTVGSDAPQLIVRAKDLMDNSQPSANSAACYGLLRLAALTGNERYRQHAQHILRTNMALAAQAPSTFGLLLSAWDFAQNPVREIVIAGDCSELVTQVQRQYLPDSVLSWGEPAPYALWEGRRDTHAAYVCADGVCQAPATTAAELQAALDY